MQLQILLSQKTDIPFPDKSPNVNPRNDSCSCSCCETVVQQNLEKEMHLLFSPLDEDIPNHDQEFAAADIAIDEEKVLVLETLNPSDEETSLRVPFSATDIAI